MVLLAASIAACAPAPAASPRPSPSTSAVATATPTSTPTSAATPTPTATPAPTAAPTATPGGSASAGTAACTPPGDPSHNLVLGTLQGSSATVLRDITNTAAAVTLPCTFSGSFAPRFVTAGVLSWTEQGQNLGSPGKIVRDDLSAGGTGTAVASWTAGGFGSGLFDWSPDGTKLTYIGASSPGPTWHLLAGGTDRVLATLPPVPGRGVSPQNDDFTLAFSPDGLYLALETTFATGGSGETAPLQVRRVSDGTLVYSATSGTFAVWASVPSRLFYRDSTGGITRWDPSSGAAQMMPSLAWTRPHASPDGRWIAYTTYDSGSLPHVGLYSVQANSLGPQPAGLRSGALFLNNALLWYQEEASTGCGLGGCSTPTGNAFIYDIAGSTEAASRITSVYDVWPRVTAPPGLG